VHSADVQHKVKCTTAEMTVEMMLPDSVTDVYLEGMKEYGKEVGMMPMHFFTFLINTNIFSYSRHVFVS
jgi:hypothetical protein